MTLFLSNQVPPSPQPSSTCIIAKADSGASRHYLRDCDKDVLLHPTPTDGPTVYLPDMSTVSATSKGSLPLPHLSPAAIEAHVFNNLPSSSLISLGQLCDDNCTILLNKHMLQIFKNNNQILNLICNKTDGLWDIKLHKAPPLLQQKANVIVKKSTAKKYLIQFVMEPDFLLLNQHFFKP